LPARYGIDYGKNDEDGGGSDGKREEKEDAEYR
jgi:hypothetical protein